MLAATSLTAQQLVPQSLQVAAWSIPVPEMCLQSAAASLPILLGGINDGQQLLSRVDHKFIVPTLRLPELLPRLAANFAVLPAGSVLFATYVTVYFDTEDGRFLRDHLRGKRPRLKVRIRHYLDRQLSFLECKTKLPNGRTDKLRCARPFGDNQWTRQDQLWLATQAGCVTALRPVAWTACHRLSLVGVQRHERLTLDVAVTTGTHSGARRLKDHVIVEWKRRPAEPSAVLKELRQVGAQSVSFSKFVAAMLTAQPQHAARFRSVLGRYVRPDCWEACSHVQRNH